MMELVALSVIAASVFGLKEISDLADDDKSAPDKKTKGAGAIKPKPTFYG